MEFKFLVQTYIVCYDLQTKQKNCSGQVYSQTIIHINHTIIVGYTTLSIRDEVPDCGFLYTTILIR